MVGEHVRVTRMALLLDHLHVLHAVSQKELSGRGEVQGGVGGADPPRHERTSWSKIQQYSQSE